MGKTLYLECNSGISGDMAVAALLDIGADKQVLGDALDSLPVKGFSVEITRVKKAGLDVCDFLVKLDTSHENHDHDMTYLHGHDHGHLHGGEGHENHHGEEIGHDHEHSHHGEAIGHGHERSHHGEAEAHGHEHHYHGEVKQHVHEHPHEHRGLPEILDIIDKAKITARAKDTAARIFHILARAEAKAHGVSMEQVHFHEVGAVDSIVDIVAVAVCLDNLDITEVIVPFVCEGTGTVRCQHGILPVPVPAVVNIMEACQLPVRITEVKGELVTPTGAAIAAAVMTSSRLPEQFKIVKTGMGAGKRSYERPSLLRAILIEPEDCAGEDNREDVIYKLETNIDDCTGEILGYVMERLLEAGARDAHFIPVYMKKNRPAYELTVICDESSIGKLEQIIFEETTTIGIRRMKMERTILPRKSGSIMIDGRELKVKKCTLPDGQVRCYPEYDSVVELAKEKGCTLGQIMDAFRHTV
ncbi:MAG: nickel pincer cofactor biosynthesis protein LarC [Lachnospiraceae bacterium]|nr:nickel pincer cofactor biosynthesis protein LarC [Lachnospiraceae bacterium]